MECRSFRNIIPQFCHSAKNHSAKKTFRNATIWQNNSAKNIRKLGIGNNLFRKRTIGNLHSAKVDNEINYLAKYALEIDIRKISI